MPAPSIILGAIAIITGLIASISNAGMTIHNTTTGDSTNAAVMEDKKMSEDMLNRSDEALDRVSFFFL